MTQEEKQLLLVDLCARLPYMVKVRTPYNDATLIGIIRRKAYKKGEEYIDAITDEQTYPIRYIKPYLRPMSSMTDAEKKEYYYLCYDEHVDVFEHGEWETEIYFHDTIESIDWLNKNHFDYLGLIERGLAIEVTEENNPYEG